MFFKGTGSDYAILLTNAYEAIKSSDIEAQVICAMIYSTHGPLGLPDAPGSRRDPNSFTLEFFKKLAELNNRRPYDIIDHHWIMIEPKISPKKQYLLLKEELTHIDKTAKMHGFQSAPFESLETAVLSPDEKTQAYNLLTHYVYALSCGVKKIFWSGLKVTPDSLRGQADRQRDDPFRQNAIIYGDGMRKLTYYTYKKMVDVLDGSDWERTETIQAKDDIYIFKFIKNSTPIWVLWNDGKKTKLLKIQTPKGASQVKITEAIPKCKYGKSVSDYNNAFNEIRKKADNSNVEVMIGDIPLFIEVVKGNN